LLVKNIFDTANSHRKRKIKKTLSGYLNNKNEKLKNLEGMEKKQKVIIDHFFHEKVTKF
jgi:hypothetical protein